MSTMIVFQQMLVVFILIGTGFFLFRSNRLKDAASKDFSILITNVCNPAMVLCSAFDESNTATNRDILIAAAVAVILYSVLVLVSMIIPRVLGAPRQEWKFYKMMTVYGNIGFMGIPVTSAVLGSGALIYLTVFILAFNILVYTHGIHVLTRDLQEQREGQWKRMFNVGTLSGVLTVLIFMLRLPVPTMLQDTLSYMGRCTTYLSMVVLGASAARMSMKEFFGEKRLYAFAGIRFLLLPIFTGLVLRIFITNPLILGVAILTLALPVANMPLMLSEEYHMENRLLAKGIILTTILSLFSVPLSVMVVTL